ncbi:hypothetical protein ACFQ88_22365 [Paenibacillus sp. NPDC056579]|uniref:hypothetical protein n=1 Tax=Paenibacillus sp. NPDC056579 TaxID=3345871 RepID=UPI0036B83C46
MSNPAFGYYYSLPGSYYEIREDAIRKFKKHYPHGQLYAVSSTLQGFYAREGIQGTPVAETRFMRKLGKIMNYFLILRNLANYRKRDGYEWQVAHLIRRVKHATPQRYDL